ncbi:MAG: hypothetical protein AB7Q01_06100 [Gammaproteobacteria bacterium]
MSRADFKSPYPAVTHLLRLGTPELVLVMTLRLWFAAAFGPATRETAFHWQDGLGAAGVSKEGSMAFHELMEAIVLETRKPLDFRPRHCPHLGRDEGRLLQIISLLQHGGRSVTTAILSAWMSPSASRIASKLALRLAEELTQAGLTLPSRSVIISCDDGSSCSTPLADPTSMHLH